MELLTRYARARASRPSEYTLAEFFRGGLWLLCIIHPPVDGCPSS